MSRKAANVNSVLKIIEKMDVDSQTYVSEVLSKRLIELRRATIAKRAREAEKAYREGNVKKGSAEELWKDLND